MPEASPAPVMSGLGNDRAPGLPLAPGRWSAEKQRHILLVSSPAPTNLGARKLAVHPHAVDDPRDPYEEADQEGQAEEHDDDLEQASTFHEAMMPQALRPSLSGQTSASGTEPARPPVSTANAPDTAWGRRPAPEQVRHVLAAPLRWLPAAGNAGSSSAAPSDLRSGAGGSRRDSSCQSDPAGQIGTHSGRASRT